MCTLLAVNRAVQKQKRIILFLFPDFLRDLPVVGISPEWVTNPGKVNSSGRLLSVVSGQACFGMAFLPFLMKQLYTAVTGYSMSRLW